jgi:hypothetical protein
VTADVVALIEQAIREGIARGEAADGEEWESFYTVHGDPFVIRKGEPRTGRIATIATDNDDYGRSIAEHVAGHSPADALRAHHADLELLAWTRTWEAADTGPLPGVCALLLANLQRRYNVPTEETP